MGGSGGSGGASEGGGGAAGGAPPIAPWINEVHYDNDGVDVQEGFEIAGPAGFDLAGYQAVLYNGPTSPQVYDTVALSGILPDQQNGFGTLWFGVTILQNGPQDGICVVTPTMEIVEFLGYEGTFTGGDGVCDGQPSAPLPVVESNITPEGQSLQLTGTGSEQDDFDWVGPSAASPGAVNTGQTMQ
jgi:hypothetical protein